MLRSLSKTEGETWHNWYLRVRYEVLRRVHPRYREQYNLEVLVGPKNCWDQLVQYQFNILTRLGLKPHHSLLDIGCGPLTAGLKTIPYLERGNYVGLDVRPAALITAYRLLAKHALAHHNPVLINSHTFGREEFRDHLFDYIWMSQLSYHLTDDQMETLFEQARARMKPDSVFLFDIIEPTRVLPPGSSWSGFSFYIRPFDFFHELGRRFDLTMNLRNQIREYGYPEHIDLKTNHLLEFRRGSESSDPLKTSVP